MIILLAAWYAFCFFPDDQEYLKKISESVKAAGDHLEVAEPDLLRVTGSAAFTKKLTAEDRAFLLKDDLRTNDFYIDENPYGPGHENNLKYSTGRIFYYTYQKNSLVLKADSAVAFNLDKCSGSVRFLDLSTAFPSLAAGENSEGTISIYFKQKLILEKKISREIKPDIKPFRYSSFLSSLVFYLKHPGRSVLTDYTGWGKIKADIPNEAGTLEIKFKCGGQKSYLFLGSPAVYAVKEKARDRHVNIVYLIFDTLSKDHIDLYEYYDEFSKNNFIETINKLGPEKILTPVIDAFADRALIFENMQSAGQVTRPSIVSLWTSQVYTKCRQPVVRNIVTKENAAEFYGQRFSTLGAELSKYGYISKQIACNAQGHGVSGVGVDLGFGENYDYTMEASEHTENVRRVIEFLEENQNRKFFLYSHLNVPHDPMWIPLSYFISAYIDSGFRFPTAKTLGNIRYLNDCLEKIINAVKTLNLDKNTLVIITADHGRSPVPYLRGELTERDKKRRTREPQSIAYFYSRSIYAKKGKVHLYSDYMNIPFIMIPPENLKFMPGKVSSFVSELDISPTLLDIAEGKKCGTFSGSSFRKLLTGAVSRDKVFSDFIPLIGRFQNGYILDGRYKYWINLPGLYKFKNKNGMKYLMGQEYLFDLAGDPYETVNLAGNPPGAGLLRQMRKTFFSRFEDFPDKNFFQISPAADGKNHIFSIRAVSKSGNIKYPRFYGEGISYKYLTGREIVFNCETKDKNLFFSFETDPSDSPLIINILKDGALLPKNNIYSSVERINYFDNPIILNDKTDFHISREPGRTGLEPSEIPPGSVHYSRIPLNYWLEMNASDRDIQLSPGIKEVLRGWGYIQ